MARVRLARRHHIAPGDAIEEPGEIEEIENRHRRLLEFVGADHHAMAVGAQGCECFRHPRICPRRSRGRSQVEGPIALEQFRHRRRLDLGAAKGEGPAHQFGGAVADQSADRGKIQRRPAQLRQQPVEGARQVRRAVDQCAVQIEDQIAASTCHGFPMRDSLCAGEPSGWTRA